MTCMYMYVYTYLVKTIYLFTELYYYCPRTLPSMRKGSGESCTSGMSLFSNFLAPIRLQNAAQQHLKKNCQVNILEYGQELDLVEWKVSKTRLLSCLLVVKQVTDSQDCKVRRHKIFNWCHNTVQSLNFIVSYIPWQQARCARISGFFFRGEYEDLGTR